jgi:8-oxo-dGTP diphosphatase
MDNFLPDDPRRYPKSPRVSAHTIVRKGNQVLLVKRGYEPFKGEWAPPGGGIELGETVYDAGKREVLEETSVDVEIDDIQDIENFIRRDAAGKVEAHVILIRLLAHYVSGVAKAGDDAADVGWFTADEVKKIPWPPYLHDLVLQAFNSH